MKKFEKDRAIEAPLVRAMARERLRRAVADLTLDKLILAEAARGNWALLHNVVAGARVGVSAAYLGGHEQA